MNNFLLSIIFLICLILYYLVVGSFFLTKMKIEKNRFAVYVVVGWIITFVLGWITGFPAQLNAKSWYYFANHFQIALILMGLVAIVGNIVFHKEKIKEIIGNTKKKPINILYFFLDHLKRYWFIYLFVGVFTWFSITNLQPYTLLNYTDDHYIIKMFQNLKANKLLTKDVMNGNTLISYGKYGYAKQYSHRMFNTYEIVYSYLANLSGIHIVFFARVTMTVHNYLIWFLVMQLLGSIFLESNSSQYSITPFALLLIPAGFSARGIQLLKIRIFENWRNQTAIYMGGSIVRNVAFPFYLYLLHLLNISKEKLRILLILLIFSLLLLSYQTTAISYFIIFIPLFIIGIILNNIWKKVDLKNKKFNLNLILVTIPITIIVVILLALIWMELKLEKSNKTQILGFFSNLFNWSILSKGISSKALTSIYNNYYPYYLNVFKLDTFAKIAPIVFVFIFFISKNIESKVITLVSFILYYFFRVKKFKLIISLITFEYFGAARMLNSVILLVLFFSGLCIYLLIFKIYYVFFKDKKDYTWEIVLFISCFFLIGTLSYVKLNMKSILHYTKDGDGIIKEGFSTKPITNNDLMIPNEFIEIGKYFDNLPNRSYVYSSKVIKINGYNYSNKYLLLSSKNVALTEVNWSTYNYEISNNDIKHANILKKRYEANWWLDKVLNEKKGINSYKLAKKAINNSDVNYALITKKVDKKILCSNGWKVTEGSSKKGYWILKR